jgi:hypothetical protein
MILGLILVGTAALADKDKRGRGEEREWRDYYQEREEREAHGRQERARQERAWQDYNRERQRQGYRPAPAGPQVEIRIGGYFGYPQRTEVYNYYHERARRGFCPPGLAKKDNGCMPPGQQRVWVVGRPLPPDVVYYPIEPAVQVRLGVPPPGHEFIRVASDILLIAVGTGMVVDAIQDLGR